jgi:hypothetical protein
LALLFALQILQRRDLHHDERGMERSFQLDRGEHGARRVSWIKADHWFPSAFKRRLNQLPPLTCPIMPSALDRVS